MSLLVRKDIGSLLAEARAGTLRRELGPLALVTLGIGAVIGAGISSCPAPSLPRTPARP